MKKTNKSPKKCTQGEKSKQCYRKRKEKKLVKLIKKEIKVKI